MITGLDVFKAVIKKVKSLDPGAKLRLHPEDLKKLLALTEKQLKREGKFSPDRAKEVFSELEEGKTDALAKALGVRFVRDSNAPRVIPQ